MKTTHSDEELAKLYEQGPDLPHQINPTDLLAIMEAKNAQAKADLMMRQAVANARENGVTWQQVGDILGVTRQAAHSKYAHVI